MVEGEARQTFSGWIEAMLRRFWARLGAALDRLTKGQSGSGVDLGAIMPLVEQAIENRLRHEGGRLVAPHLIDLRFAYETYAGLTNAQREKLRRQLSSGVTEYLYNRRYQVAGEVRVNLGFDPFTQRLVVKASFPGEQAGIPYAPARENALESGSSGRRIRLRGKGGRRLIDLESKLEPGVAPIGLGRSRDNALVVDEASVSNFHASFTLGSDAVVYLSDLGSSNGTFVNGEALDTSGRRALQNGDRLRFGDIEVAFEILQ